MTPDEAFEVAEIKRLATALVEVLATSRLEGTDTETQLALMGPLFAEYSGTLRITPGRGIDVTSIVGSGAVIAALLVDMLEDVTWCLEWPPDHHQIFEELRQRMHHL